MGFRVRKSFKVAPGVRVNVGKKSAGISVGTKGARVSVNSRTGARATVGIPGSGISYTTSLNSSKKCNTSSYKRNSELKSMQSQIDKFDQLQKNKLEVEMYENKLEMIQSIHKECDEDFNWNGIAQTPAPFDLSNGEIGKNERKALSDLENYKPSFFNKLLKNEEIKRDELEKAVTVAKEKDKTEYEEWKSLNLLANEVLNRNMSLYLPIIEEMHPFDDLLEFGSGFEFFIYEPNWLEIDFDVNTETVVPKEIKSLTTTGKVSTKQMPKGKYFEIQQDYICSCVIRMARDLFALLPIDYVVINALDNRLDTSTGISKKEVILSVKIEKKKLSSMYLDFIDPSDSMNRFECNMNFKKLSGLQPVDRLIERDEI